MSTFNWSTTGFPNPSNDLSVGVNPGVWRIDMESGRPRQLKKFTTAMRTIPVQWQLTDAQWALFQGVLEYKLNQGSDWFLINLPVGNGLQQCTARFVKGSWNAKQVPVLNWNVTAQLDVQGGSILSEAEVDALLLT